jgi:hypothetical protein
MRRFAAPATLSAGGVAASVAGGFGASRSSRGFNAPQERVCIMQSNTRSVDREKLKPPAQRDDDSPAQSAKEQDNAGLFVGGWLRNAADTLGKLLELLSAAGIIIGGWGQLLLIVAYAATIARRGEDAVYLAAGIMARRTFVVSLAVFNLCLMRRAPNVSTYAQWLFGQCVLIAGNFVVALVVWFLVVLITPITPVTLWETTITVGVFALVIIGIIYFHTREHLLERAGYPFGKLLPALNFLSIAGIFIGGWGCLALVVVLFGHG